MQVVPTRTRNCPILTFVALFACLQVHGECVTIKTRFRPVPLRWVFCHKAPRQGAVLEDLTLQQQQQQQQGGAAAIGRLNPRLKMDEWVEEELK